ncbi:dimethylaniline monooxygenase [n-oxide-forming] [Plakobranchus ocellatus]|uniref:Flavin-containing monooxygenase n=1 Tax=Plakobranchus ocellatus TaxID=259542 RepID=A0AAV4CRP8_9GAST|nr:dimethylaniline monooxygenase [n-oxide-forming] [Plakobranchus ocellatus]
MVVVAIVVVVVAVASAVAVVIAVVVVAMKAEVVMVFVVVVVVMAVVMVVVVAILYVASAVAVVMAVVVVAMKAEVVMVFVVVVVVMAVVMVVVVAILYVADPNSIDLHALNRLGVNGGFKPKPFTERLMQELVLYYPGNSRYLCHLFCEPVNPISGRWEVTSHDLLRNKTITEVFDFVVIANGCTAHPKLPRFPGLDKFRGKTMHSLDFKDTSGWEEKRACVVGIGNSGSDIACELSNYRQVLLSVRSGAWFINRLGHKGLPFDLSYHSRYRWLVLSWLPRRVRNRLWRRLYSQVVDHQLYGLNPPEQPDASIHKITDDLSHKIASGLVKIKPDIREFTETGIIFEDGTCVDGLDLVIFSTGYSIHYPFLDLAMLGIPKEDADLKLYKHMFAPDLPHQTLAFLSVAQYTGGTFPSAEMQCRLAAAVFKGNVHLPNRERMKAEIASYQANLESRYVSKVREPRRVDHLLYMDELASLVGCKPNLAWFLLTDPVLFWHLLFGPGVAYQYRLQGPNTWPEARHAILTVMDRIREPFKKFQATPAKPQTSSSTVVLAMSKYLIAGCIAIAIGFIAHRMYSS